MWRHAVFPWVVLADAEFDSEAHPAHSATPGSEEHHSREAPGCPECAIRNQMFRAFPKKPYRNAPRSKHLLGRQTQALFARARRSLATQIRQALLLGLAYNLYCLRHRFPQRGCQQSPSVVSKGLRNN